MRRTLQRITLTAVVLQTGSCTAVYSSGGGLTGFVSGGGTGGGGGGGVGQAVPNAGQAFTPGQAPRTNYNGIFGAGGGP